MYETVTDMGLTQQEREDRSVLFVHRAVEQVYPSPEHLSAELSGDRKMTAYMGIDPTAPDLHVGHESQLLKLREIQQLGHNVILLIGDFTGMIGDPTDKSAARVKLTKEEVIRNAASYREQASMVLDFNHPTNPIQLKYNSEWLGKMSFSDVLELAGEFTVQQMLERDMFEKRIASGKPVYVNEFLYPAMQGWDSVCMTPDGVDIEVGGSDQIFNMLTGSTLIRRFKNKQKFVVAGKLLVDPTGKKIGKTEGNMVTMTDDPASMYHKIMMWGDAIVPHALELCTSMPMQDIEKVRKEMELGKLTGLEGKHLLANKIVAELHDEAVAVSAASEYAAITGSTKNLNTEVLTTYSISTGTGTGIVELLKNSGLATSNSQARRLLLGNAVRINGEQVDETWTYTSSDEDQILQVGKKKISNYRMLKD